MPRQNALRQRACHEKQRAPSATVSENSATAQRSDTKRLKSYESRTGALKQHLASQTSHPLSLPQEHRFIAAERANSCELQKNTVRTRPPTPTPTSAPRPLTNQRERFATHSGINTIPVVINSLQSQQGNEQHAVCKWKPCISPRRTKSRDPSRVKVVAAQVVHHDQAAQV